MDRSRHLGRGLLPILFAGVLLLACSQGVPPELTQAAYVIHYMMKPANLSNSAFSAALENPKPSQFVSYIFSEMGVAEWPDSDAFGELEREQIRAVGAPTVPDGVAFVPRTLDPERGKQIVVGFDDPRGMVIVEGYVDPRSEPVIKRDWRLQNVSPALGMRQKFRTAAEAGFADQAF